MIKIYEDFHLGPNGCQLVSMIWYLVDIIILLYMFSTSPSHETLLRKMWHFVIVIFIRFLFLKIKIKTNIIQQAKFHTLIKPIMLILSKEVMNSCYPRPTHSATNT